MTVDPMLVTLLAELLVVTSAIAIGMAVSSFLGKKQDRKAVQALVAKIKGGQEQRLEESRELLSTKFGLEEQQAAELATNIDHAERGLYQSMITICLQRDHAAIEQLDVKFMGAVEIYRALTPAAVGGSSESEEIERLRGEAERLSAELKSTMETMGGVLNDYSSVLSGGMQAETQELDLEVVEERLAPAEDVVEEEEVAVEVGDVEEDAAEKLEVSTAVTDEVDIPDYHGLDE